MKRSRITRRFKLCWFRIPKRLRMDYLATIEDDCRNKEKRFTTTLGEGRRTGWAVETQIGDTVLLTTFHFLDQDENDLVLHAVTVK